MVINFQWAFRTGNRGGVFDERAGVAAFARTLEGSRLEVGG